METTLTRLLPRLPRLGIRSRLLLLVLALGLPFLTYLLLSTAKQANDEREQAREQMLAMAQLTAARLDDHIGNMQQVLATLSHAVGVHVEDTDRNDALLRRLRPDLPQHVNNVTVWTRNGENIGSLDPELRAQPFTVTDRRYFQDALRGHGLAAEAPIISRSNGEPIVVFAFPTINGEESVGVVAASTRLRSLQTLLDPKGALPPGAVITVVDLRGTVLSNSLEPEKWIGQSLPQGRVSIAERLKQGSGTDDVQSLDGVERIFGFSAVRALPWLVYVGVPTQTALAPVRGRLYESLLLGGVMFAIGLALAAWVAENLSRSLRRLSADAVELGKGTLGHRSHVVSGGEIALLADNLNHMAEALEERSAALRRSERRLRSVTDNLPALVSYLDREQRFRFANRAYFHWLGIDPEALIGQHLRDLYGDVTYERVRAHVETALAGEEVDYERELQTLGGVRHIQARLVPDREEDGSVRGIYAMLSDITDRREAALRLTRSEERLSLALEGSGLALFDWDIPGDSIYYSAQASVFRGGPPVETTATCAEMCARVHPDDLPPFLRALTDTLKGASTRYHAEYRLRHESGEWIWVRSRGRVVERDDNGRALRFAGTLAEVTERKRDEQRLRQLAEMDTLTGLPNRLLFFDRLAQALLRAARGRRRIALFFLDIDYFKRINDTHGHEAGDQLLRAFAERMVNALRKSDTVARLAGDEFTIIVEAFRELSDVHELAQKLVTAARDPVSVGERELQVSTSIGFAISTPGETDGAALLRRADAALYEAKRRGRDGYWCDEDDAVGTLA